MRIWGVPASLKRDVTTSIRQSPMFISDKIMIWPWGDPSSNITLFEVRSKSCLIGLKPDKSTSDNVPSWQKLEMRERHLRVLSYMFYLETKLNAYPYLSYLLSSTGNKYQLFKYPDVCLTGGSSWSIFHHLCH